MDSTNQDKIVISVVTPVYKAEKIVDELISRVSSVLSKISENYEIILVEDHSPDQSWERISVNCKRDSRIKGIKFSRNFGQHYAITAGLMESKGEYVVVMDCDLQDNPKYITTMYEKALEGHDVVLTRKKKRKHSFIKNFLSICFYRIFNWLCDMKGISANTGNFSLMNRKVVGAFCQLKDAHRYFLMTLEWVGFSQTYIDIYHEKRFEGSTSYSISKLLRLSIDGITAYSDKLLKISIGLGFGFVFCSLLISIYLVILYFTQGFLAGWTSNTILTLMCTGIILIAIGVMGIYISKIFEQVKERPLFLTDKKINCSN